MALVTGFEPYPNAAVNPSGEIARMLEGSEVGGFRVVGRVLPVSAATTPERLRSLINEVRPDLILMLGVWPGRTAFQVERVALNVLDFPFPDNDGAQPVDVPVNEQGPAALLATAPVKEVREAWRAAGLPGVVSSSAGTYLCNQSFFVALEHLAGTDVPIAFVHIPAVLSEASQLDPPQPGLPLATLCEGAKVALEAIVTAISTYSVAPVQAR